MKPPVLTCDVPLSVRLPAPETPDEYWKRLPTVRATLIVMPPKMTLTFCGALVVGQ